MRRGALKQRPTAERKVCPYCGKDFNARGYGRHEQSCRPRHTQEQVVANIGDDLDLPSSDGEFFHPLYYTTND